MSNATQLPAEVVETDHRLQRTADELMELRWHWTMDESNPDRISQKGYAKQVGVDQSRINRDVNAWADYLAAKEGYDGTGIPPGAPQTASDFRELRKLSSDRQAAAQAIAAATGTNVQNVARNRREEVDEVLATAQARAERRGTMPEAELDEAAKDRHRARQRAKEQKDSQKISHTLQFLRAEGRIARMIQTGKQLLDDVGDTAFTDDERQLLAESIGKLRGLLDLIDLRFTGSVDVDWDSELAKLSSRE